MNYHKITEMVKLYICLNEFKLGTFRQGLSTRCFFYNYNIYFTQVRMYKIHKIWY